MRYLLLSLGLLLPFLSFAQDEIEYKEYSYSEFFQMIEDEEDSIFKLSNAVILYDSLHDDSFSGKMEFSEIVELDRTDSLIVDKIIDLNNVQFVPFIKFLEGLSMESALINHFTFKKKVTLRNSLGIFYNNTFEGGLSIIQDQQLNSIINEINKTYFLPDESINYHFTDFEFYKNIVQESINIRVNSAENQIKSIPNIVNNTFKLEGSGGAWVRINNLWRIQLRRNLFSSKTQAIEISFAETERLSVEGNIFDLPFNLVMTPMKADVVNIQSNTFYSTVHLETENILPNHNIAWKQWAGKAVSRTNFSEDFLLPSMQEDFDKYTFEDLQRIDFLINKTKEYQEVFLAKNERAYRNDIRFKSGFYNRYKENHDTENANLVYMEIKDLETRRLEYLYQQNPSFKTFFKWRINQFLKVFSAYGTEPERAIIFSVYVILAFALVYLFFPNHWDSHGKNRIMDRYRFFLKYVNKDSGMHEVYLDEKKPELLASEDFKVYLQEQGKTAPKFFMATALPLYRWSVAGTKSFSWLLSKVDVLKGKWSDTEDSKKGVKTVLLISAFLISLTYDIFIKMLNALMLSINTFTTLGFGEIPIKGLPRYLAIIQGFIGWFMLTIFSVSLISQLLN